MSMESAPQGAKYKTATTVALAAYWLALFAATHVPRIPEPLQTGVSDKLLHYLAYAVLSFLLSLWIVVRRRFTMRAAVAVVAITEFYGAIDELLQTPVGRETDILDWRADAIGAVTGLIAFLLLLAIARRRRRKTSVD